MTDDPHEPEVSMYPATTFSIRLAGDADEPALRDLAALDGRAPLEHPILIGEIDGEPAAALALDERRTIADPFRHTGLLLAHLRMRAAALDAHAHAPRVSDRIRAALAPRPGALSAA